MAQNSSKRFYSLPFSLKFSAKKNEKTLKKIHPNGLLPFTLKFTVVKFTSKIDETIPEDTILAL